MRTIFLVKSSEQFRSPARKQNNWGGLTFGLGNTTHFGGFWRVFSNFKWASFFTFLEISLVNLISVCWNYSSKFRFSVFKSVEWRIQNIVFHNGIPDAEVRLRCCGLSSSTWRQNSAWKVYAASSDEGRVPSSEHSTFRLCKGCSSRV